MSWRTLFKFELTAIFTNPSLLFTVFGGVLIYSFLYPLPYSQQLPREQAIAVVNLDNSQMSRELERMVDATPQVHIAKHVYNIEEAKSLLIKGDVHGLMVIPTNFYRDVLLGKSPTVAYAGDAAYFLVYGTIVEGLATAGGTLGAKAESRMVMSGDNLVLASEQYSAMKLNMRPVFNPTMGYINYVVPAVFVLILQQTLMIAAGILGGGQNEYRLQGGTGYWLRYSAWKIVLVRTLLLVLIYIPLVAYYFGYSFSSYHISRLASISDLVAMTIPFLLAVIFVGIIIGQLIPRRELATLIILLSSLLPLVFAAGFIWPVSAIPAPINALAQLAPSTPAINGFLRLNQMGASFEQVINWWGQLWLQALVYGCIAVFLVKRNQEQGNVKQVPSE